VDVHAEMAFAEAVRSVVSRDLDELHVRVDRLEKELAAQPPGEPPQRLVLTIGQ
jgi:hypothetical protein